ncbi:hypothetical protein HRG_014476 [Hirsutella rhossiliensis]
MLLREEKITDTPLLLPEGRGFDRFLGLVTEAGFFDRICHRH